MAFFYRYSKKELIVYITVGFLIIFCAYYFVIPTGNEVLCSKKKSTKSKEIRGVIQKVYVDEKEHMNEIVEYSQDGDSELKILVLTADKSNLFQFLKPGDHLRKKKGSLLVHINGDTAIKIDYGVSYAQCNKK